MAALANSLEQMAQDNFEIDAKTSISVDDYQYLLELTNDLYIAALETHLAAFDSNFHS